MGMLEFEGKGYPDGRDSDPREFGWMHGAPPPPDKRITFESGRFLHFPQIRWSLSHMRELAATANVERGQPAPFERRDRAADIDALTFVDMNGRARRFEDALYDSYADGLVVLHRGRIVYERYFGALEPHLPHSCFSVTKSFAGTLTAAFVHEGVLDDTKTIPHYLPELGSSAWKDATLRQVMDMETGLAYTEDYVDENSGVSAYGRSFGWRPVGYDGPKTMCDYLRTVSKEGAHGEKFAYKTVNTEVMAWVMARVTGRSFAELLHERLWVPLGCEQDAYIRIDPAGMQSAGGGLSAALRDVARFGELMRCKGDWKGKQLIPESVVVDVQKGGNQSRFSKGAPGMPKYSYRSMWWVTHNELDAFEGRGIHGQRLYVAPKADMVVARFASHPVASSMNDKITLPQMLALGKMLRE
ncbi:serine hydrolase [Bradyrhizobium sp. 17]|uniref:serine hydrolase domain-containing protein n=1 Tax=Bradyrhizobium sp. 17 TaxID=2782649 RepID=UPI001FFBDE3A|nr:serine hydrolase [Bradyrhizobium sp. 17]MCK1518844.1 serine hydrolase [Bradyrhizobium sp. 17]